MITRRRMIKTLCALPFAIAIPETGNAQVIFDFQQIKAGYAQRLNAFCEPPWLRVRSLSIFL